MADSCRPSGAAVFTVVGIHMVQAEPVPAVAALKGVLAAHFGFANRTGSD